MAVIGQVAELVYAHASGACAARLEGSSPSLHTGTVTASDTPARVARGREQRNDILSADKIVSWWSDKVLRRQNFSRDESLLAHIFEKSENSKNNSI